MEFAGVGKPTPQNTRSEYVIVQEMDNTEKECLLYLPLFSEIKSLRIGIKESANISAIDYPFKKKILIYGSSIVHGAEASRAEQPM